MKKIQGSDCKEFKVQAGRSIVCKKNNKELFIIRKDEGFSPTEADAMAHYIVDTLNAKKDFKRYYKNYMR